MGGWRNWSQNLAERPAAAGAAELHRRWHSPGSPHSTCCEDHDGMAERYPGYDVLAKRHTPSWNEQTRRVIDQRLAMPREPRFFSRARMAALWRRSATASCRSPGPGRRFRSPRWSTQAAR